MWTHGKKFLFLLCAVLFLTMLCTACGPLPKGDDPALQNIGRESVYIGGTRFFREDGVYYDKDGTVAFFNEEEAALYREACAYFGSHYELILREGNVWLEIMVQLRWSECPEAVIMTDEFQQLYRELKELDALLGIDRFAQPEPPTLRDRVLSVATPTLIIAAGIFAYLKLRRLYGRIRARRPVP
ncbi:hypothetical protein D1159_18830 [Pseudoflavonifractor sp. 524-17]|nr:hypothetical protein [Pseudoflavonifractor sp. 524-17]